MIHFYRRLRQSFLQKGKFNRYLLYAAGEILLVVFGILIALQVNNWNQQNKTNRQETALLQQLEKDLDKSLSDISFNIRLIDKGIHSAEFLLDYMVTDRPYEDSLASHFASSFPWTRLIINSGAFETIKSQGIEIISDIELRDKIITLFEGKLYFQRQLEDILQNYSEHLRREEFVNYFKSSFADFGLREAYDAGISVPKDYSRLKVDESFRYHLSSFLELMKVVQNRGNLLRKKEIEDLISAIQKDLSSR